MLNTGRNGGVTGLLDMYGDNATYSAPTLAVRVYGWDWNLFMERINRSGRAGRPKSRMGDPNAELEFEGTEQLRGYPIPQNFQFTRGNLTLQATDSNNQLGSACTIMMPVRPTSFNVKRENEKSERSDSLEMSGKLILDGAVSISWNGTQSIISSATLNYAQTDVGLAKVYDPNNLITQADQRIDVEGVADNDTSEVATLVSYIAGASAPMSGVKTVNLVFHRTDGAGGYFTYKWGLVDSKDEHQLPTTKTTLDPLNLESNASIGLVGTSSSTATLSGFAYRKSTLEQLTNGTIATQNNYITISELGLRTTVEDRTFPATFILQDPNSLNSVARALLIGNNSAPSFTESGFTLRSLKVTQETSSLGTNNQYVGDFELGLRNTVQDHTFPGTFINADPSSLNTTALTTVIGTSSAPTLSPSNLVVRSSKVVRLTSTLANDMYEGTFEQGLRSTAEDRTLPGTTLQNDSNGLFTTAEVTVVGNNTAPTLSLPSGFPATLKTVRSATQQLTSSLGTNNQYETKWNLGLKSTIDETLFPHYVSTRDLLAPWVDESPALYNNNATVTVPIQASALMAQYQNTSIGGSSLHGITVRQLVDGKQLAIFHYKNVGVLVEFDVKPGTNELAVRANPTNSAVAQMYVIQNFPYGRSSNTASSYRHMLVFSYSEMQSRIVRDFTIYYEAKGIQVPDAPPAVVNGNTVPAPGTINAGTFMGLPAGTVKYMGVRGKTNLELLTNGSMNFMLGYRFHYDSASIWDFVPKQAYQRRYIAQLPSLLVTGQTGSGWVDVNTTTSPIFPTITQPQTASFAALAPY